MMNKILPLDHFKTAGNLDVKNHEECNWIQDVLDWMENTVAKPTSNIKRKGALCPFVPKALGMRSIYLTFPKKKSEDIKQLTGYMKSCMVKFLEIPPTIPDESAIYKSLIVAFPYLNETNSMILKKVRSEVKPYLIQNGVTCGEFFADNVDRSVRNEDFYVAKSPVPLITIRYLSSHDELFLQTQPELYKLFNEWKKKNEKA